MKKGKRNNHSRNQSKNNKTYSLDEYRNRKEKYKDYFNNIDDIAGTGKRSYSKKRPTSNSKPRTYNGQVQSPNEERQKIKTVSKLSRKEAQQLLKKRKLQDRKRQIILLMTVIIGVYVSIKIVNVTLYPKISYQVVSKGVINNSKQIEGIIVRDEEVYTANVDGNIHYLVAEGQRVKKGAEISIIADDGTIAYLEDEKNAMGQTLYNQQQKREDLSDYQPELHAINQGMEAEIVLFQNRRTDEPLQVEQLRNQLETMMQMRMNVYLTDTTSRTQEVQENIYDIAAELEEHRGVITAEQAGIVSYMIDGMENDITSEMLHEMDYKGYNSLLKEIKGQTANGVKHYTSQDEALYKIIQSDTWYIVTYMLTEDANAYEVGETYGLVFNELGGATIDFKLDQKIEEDKYTGLVFESRDYLTQLLPYRNVTFSIGEEKTEGLKIPLSAIVEKNMFVIPEEYVTTREDVSGNYVLRATGEITEYVKVDVEMRQDGYAYIAQQIGQYNVLKLDDIIRQPMHGDDIKVERIESIQGVYTINGRYADFKPITIESVNDDYAIISDKTPQGVKEMDQIISNPKNINENQLLRYMDVQNE